MVFAIRSGVVPATLLAAVVVASAGANAAPLAASANAVTASPTLPTPPATAVSMPASPPVRDAARVYLQRGPDGRMTLTDRPTDDARTERTWAMEREDPEAARARTDKVALEARLVSERVQRRIDRDNQIARDDELDRQQASAAAARRVADAADERYAVGGYLPLASRPRYRPLPAPRPDAKPVPPRRRPAPPLIDRD